jgi:predicted signal transduction protein with EAL and GGDEF domain
MKTAITLICDYCAVNRVRIRSEWLVIYLCIFIIQLIALARFFGSSKWPVFVALVLITAVVWAVVVAITMFAFAFLTAFFTIKPFAREAGVPLNVYIETHDYRQRAKEKLRISDQRRKWL